MANKVTKTFLEERIEQRAKERLDETLMQFGDTICKDPVMKRLVIFGLKEDPQRAHSS